MRKLVTIQKISKLEPIEGADQIEVATILGWHCVVKKGEFKEGDYVVYFEIDSFLPIKPEFEFLRKSCYKKFSTGEEGFRIKIIRLKGQVSQGIVFPLDILPRGITIAEGDDVTELVGVVKYEPPIPAELKGEIKGQFPSFLPKTDESRVQILQDVLTRYKGTPCYITEKIDGTSATFYLKDNEFGVCSRNLELKESEGNLYWKIARGYQIEEKLKRLGRNICLQGEIYGIGIQGNPMNIKNYDIAFFNVFDIDKYKYLDFNDFKKLINDLGLDYPVMHTVPIITEDFVLTDDIDELVKMSIKKSLINPDTWMEGIVIRPKEEIMDMQMTKQMGSNGRVSFKAINPEYLLISDN